MPPPHFADPCEPATPEPIEVRPGDLSLGCRLGGGALVQIEFANDARERRRDLLQGPAESLDIFVAHDGIGRPFLDDQIGEPLGGTKVGKQGRPVVGDPLSSALAALEFRDRPSDDPPDELRPCSLRNAAEHRLRAKDGEPDLLDDVVGLAHLQPSPCRCAAG